MVWYSQRWTASTLKILVYADRTDCNRQPPPYPNDQADDPQKVNAPSMGNWARCVEEFTIEDSQLDRSHHQNSNGKWSIKAARLFGDNLRSC